MNATSLHCPPPYPRCQERGDFSARKLNKPGCAYRLDPREIGLQVMEVSHVR
jgi:hypothetical protein